MTSATFEDLATYLNADQTPRVWSLLVTVFGELAQEDGSKISGALLGKLTGLMGVKPEAMRVALHRLRKDGWIESERRGRTSTYFLTDWGRAQSAEATPRIYVLAAVTAKASLVVCDPSMPVSKTSTHDAWINSSLVLTTKPEKFEQVFAMQTGKDAPLPDWIQQKICKPELNQLIHTFAKQLESLEAAIAASPKLSNLEISALRVLIVHGWRRIALRTPSLPDEVFPSAWAGKKCRESVATILESYPRCTLSELEASLL